MPTSEARPLGDFRKNVYSQFGEDGVVGEVLDRLASTVALDHWCVEFGAWDGVYLSNTCNLIRNRNYRAVLIEGDQAKHKVLSTNFPSDDIVKICRFVTFDGASTLDRMLAATPVPADFDFLSIDIDGCDYFIFESLHDYRPKVICIEFNPTVPNEVEFVQAKDFSVKQGSSAKSLAALAAIKGYALAAVTYCNLILVRADLKGAVLGSDSPTLETLRDDSEFKTFLFCGFDGTLLSNRRFVAMPWHSIKLDLAHNQPLPRYLRRFGSDYNFLQKLLFSLFLALRYPKIVRAKQTEKLPEKT
jgi:hypothetical protein